MEFLSPFLLFFHFPSFPFFLTSLIFVLMVLKLAKPSKYSNQKLPPGPRKLPFIGNIHQLVGSLPQHRMRDLAKKYGPLMHIKLGELSIVVVSSGEIAKEVMKTQDINFATRPYSLLQDIICYGSTDIAFAPYGDYWRQLRKICILELLSAKRVQSFRSIREEEVLSLIRFVRESKGSPINLSNRIFSLIYSITTRASVSKKSEEQEALVMTLKEIVKEASGFNIGDFFPSAKIIPTITGQKSKLERLRREVDRILDSIIDQHKVGKAATKTGGDEADEDLLDVLLRVQKNGELECPITNENIKSVIVDVFSAGSETSSIAIDWAIAELLKNQKAMEKVQAEVRQVCDKKGNVDETDLQELKYLKLVIKETLRLHPSLPLLLPRECRQNCEINGYDIPAKTKVIVNGWAIGRNPEVWTEAESFVPERFLDSSTDFKGAHFDFIPFGAGRRICPGMSFGLANVELPLAQLLYHFDWKLADGTKNEDLDMTEASGGSAARKRDLCLIAVAHRPLAFE